jgi:uncharacterized repeat protein (TIGR02543 family)
MKTVLKRLMFCLIAAALLMSVRATVKTDVSAQADDLTFYLVLDGNGSTSGSYPKTYVGTVGGDCTVPANVYGRTGYSFACWNNKPDGSGTSVGDRGHFTYTSSKDGTTLTLYAQWTPITYTVRFDGNGSTSGSISDMADLEYDEDYILSENTFERKGYTFAGWNTMANNGGVDYDDEEFVSNLASEEGAVITLYAQWTQNKYTIKFDGNGSTSGSMSNMKSCKYSSSYTLTANAFKKTGYSFAGWNTKKDGSGKSYKNKASVKKLTAKNKGTVTLYAQWSKAKYSIKYVLNDGTNAKSNPSSYTYGKAVTLKDPTRSGYTFKGWYTDKKLTKKITKISSTTSGNLTLYAGWKAKKTSSACTTCGGSGTVKCKKCKGNKTVDCSTCSGTGSIIVNGVGKETCGDCDGSGKKKCTTCKGKGTVTCSDCNGTGTKK